MSLDTRRHLGSLVSISLNQNATSPQASSHVPTTDVSTLVNEGDTLGNLGNYTGAIQYYDKALTIDPKYTMAYNGKCGILNLLKNYTEAY